MRRPSTVAEVIAQAMERRDTQTRELHLARVVKGIRGVNRLIVREKRPQDLIQQALRYIGRNARLQQRVDRFLP